MPDCPGQVKIVVGQVNLSPNMPDWTGVKSEKSVLQPHSNHQNRDILQITLIKKLLKHEMFLSNLCPMHITTWKAGEYG